MRNPVATYRLQFNRDFRFADACAIVPYFRALGVSDLYASPIFAARPGSAHGYDVTDPTCLNPELGTDEEFAALVEELRRHGMGLLLDIVPNHMAASVDNPWWADVLANGRASRYAPYFDIDWDDHPQGRLVLPILGAPLEELLWRGELRVSAGARGPSLRYGDVRIPLSKVTAAEARAAARDPARVPALLDRQAYELVYWRDGVRRLNYSRFFDISGLVGVRVEDPAVFRRTHELIVRLAREGRITGLRVDHIDGLRDPLAYLRRLRQALAPGRARPYLIVEKILLGDEELPRDWPVAGTTGYEFANLVNSLFVDPDGLRALGATYRRFTGGREPFSRVAYRMKVKAIRELFAGELERLAARLAALPASPALPPEEWAATLTQVAAGLPVYRTYARESLISRRDRAYVEEAVGRAREANPGLATDAVAFLRRVLLLDYPSSLSAGQRRRWLEFVQRWQQFTGPATAKGLEDTALYSYNRLVSMNDVGGDPGGDHLVDAVQRFHRHCAEMLKRWPQTLNATSTHDTKRSEDVRARIDALSEMPIAWARRLRRWQRMNRGAHRRAGGRTAPDPHEEVLLYQTLLGAWPLEAEAVPALRDRLTAYAIKAAREAKANTSWLDPDPSYEGALAGFVAAILDPERSGDFLDDLLRFQRRVAPCGALNSLSQTLIKIAAPGVPDFYQGAELWELSLVDPDNRRPVDFRRRAELLAAIGAGGTKGDRGPPRRLLADWRSGELKLYVTARALAFRRARAQLFRSGEYIPLFAEGEGREQLFAFARARSGEWALCAVPRLAARFCNPGRPWIRPAAWRGTALSLPTRAPERWTNVLTGETISASRTASGRSLKCRDLFRRLPVALLSGI